MSITKMTEGEERRNAIADISRAERASELLANPLYQEAITAMNAAMYTEFKDTKLAGEELRHELWQRMQLMEQFQGKFESIVKQGNKGRQTLSLLEASLKIIGLR